jgi:hypothetical protein
MMDTETAVPVATPPTRRAHDHERYPRLARELATIRAMVCIYYPIRDM